MADADGYPDLELTSGREARLSALGGLARRGGGALGELDGRSWAVAVLAVSQERLHHDRGQAVVDIPDGHQCRRSRLRNG